MVRGVWFALGVAVLGVFAVLSFSGFGGRLSRGNSGQYAGDKMRGDPQKIVEFSGVPQGWTTGINEARKGECFMIFVKRIGRVNGPILYYLLQDNNWRNHEMIRKLKPTIFQGVESYTLPSLESNGVATIYLKPGLDTWYKVNIYYIGPGQWSQLQSGTTCLGEEAEIEEVLKNIKFVE